MQTLAAPSQKLNKATLTPRLMKLPVALAARFAPPGTDRHEELVAEGYLALTKAATYWQDDRGVALETYAYAAVNRAILDAAGVSKKQGHHWRWNRIASLEGLSSRTPEGKRHRIDIPCRRPDPSERREEIEVMRRALRLLTPLQRQVYIQVVCRGVSQKMMAARLDISKHRVGDILQEAGVILRTYVRRMVTQEIP